ncbi:uncharacterized protein N0V89_003365 [Didymosphaeria variabile]|uniref:lytic cellulose monooxygenase (C4-dehydrogenating) n=1 Tax=Didymosphaeria variabile TaxID=1932322 RepID=A0A9W8XUA9_9PLEO|nr:uncharacterized protein N0V89_003365 [Didymosphaeria variabile]KAJ4358781.1 hypothetical protein N0V89_003365 [Didymosphaeria variabile]
MHFFDTLILNNTFTSPWEYIRKISPQPRTDDAFITDYDYIQPLVDPSSIDLRCGRNASTAWNTPKTAVVRAGDTVGFAVNTTVGLPIKDAPVNPWDRYANMYHPGPLTVWLSPAEDLSAYQGTNPWVKILSVVNRTAQSVPPSDDYTWKHQWGAYQAPSWNFTIPASTPAGAYLLRIEQIYPVPVGELGSLGAQFYVNCAHLRVVNDGEAKEVGDDFKVGIPGVYTYGQPEIYRWVDIGNETFDIRDWVEPGPKVWEG